MASRESASSDKVTSEEFQKLLAKYEHLIESISSSKGEYLTPLPHVAKAGQKTLQELDHFRFVEAPALFSQENPKRAMDHDDVKLLVDWKL
ncbi:DUF1479 domain protein [Colletotrichum tofieldiae]|nr:DUF1479 domain protein [Colletotrichum tofieldiae]